MARIRIEIRINESKPDDVWLVNVIDDLKAIRALSQVIRDGIWLIVDLRAGRTDVLFNLFPHLRGSLVQDTVLDKMPSKPIYNPTLLDDLVKVAFEALRPDLIRYLPF